jgi:hypothetical protein
MPTATPAPGRPCWSICRGAAGRRPAAGRAGLRDVTLELVIAGPEGEAEALTPGWQPPFPARLPRCAATRTPTPRLTDRRSGLASLTPAERELVAALDAAATG